MSPQNFTITPVSIVRSASALLGLFGASMGARAIFQPSIYSVLFGLPKNSATTSSADKNPFIPAVGIRNIASGLSIAAFAYSGNDQALGLTFIVGSLVGSFDGWILRKYKEGKGGEALSEQRKKSWMHWTGVPIILVLGTWLCWNSEVQRLYFV